MVRNYKGSGPTLLVSALRSWARSTVMQKGTLQLAGAGACFCFLQLLGTGALF